MDGVAERVGHHAGDRSSHIGQNRGRGVEVEVNPHLLMVAPALLTSPRRLSATRTRAPGLRAGADFFPVGCRPV